MIFCLDTGSKIAKEISVLRLVLAVFLIPTTAWASGVTYTDIVPGDDALSSYENVPSDRKVLLDPFIGVPVTFGEFLSRPSHANGSPGVALFDYDGDGDLDILVPNGDGATNALFANQLVETGSVSFVDVTAMAGVAGPPSQEGNSVTVADLDNDGDQDIFISGYSTHNQVFENNADGTFSDVTMSSGLAGLPDVGTSSTCVGDVNGDGLLDLFVSHTYDHTFIQVIFDPNPTIPIHNELFLNQGDMVFMDATASSGIRNTRSHIDGAGVEHLGDPGATHACAMFDQDMDGDIDILYGDDQGAIPPAVAGGINRGNLHLFRNDGSGFFEDISLDVGLGQTGSWMGLSVADYNQDGYMDFFGSNLGDANFSLFVGQLALGQQASRWFLGGPDGFTDTATAQGLPGVVTSQFGWGTSSYDYDNDGDSDILYHGDIDSGVFVTVSNPATLYDNDGLGNFTGDTEAFASTDHLSRIVYGMAVGDIDGNGFEDVVTASAFNVPLDQAIPNPFDAGGPFDAVDGFIPTFSTLPPGGDPMTEPLFFNPAIQSYPNGDLTVELNGGENGNRSANVRLIGTVGLLSEGKAPRDGIGAVVTFATRSGQRVRYPIAVGDSYGSTNSTLAHFGLGQDRRGTLDVLWPGGTKNRLYGVRAQGRPHVMPEIPCSYDTNASFGPYAHCVVRSIRSLARQGVVSRAQARRLKLSAFLAYFEEH